MGTYSLLGDPVPAGNLALQLGGRGDGRCRSEGGPDEETEPEEGEARRRSMSMSMEELRKKYSWWPSGYGKEGSTKPLHSVIAEAEEGATPKLARTTRLRME
jgi:hypothetical protein